MAKNKSRARSPQDRQSPPNDSGQEARKDTTEAQPQTATPADMARKQKRRFGHN